MLVLNSALEKLTARKDSQLIRTLNQRGIHDIEDLLWIMPLHWTLLPPVQSFTHAKIGQYLKGKGSIVDIRSYYSKQKGRTKRYNISVKIQDYYGSSMITLRWPYAYPSQKKKIEQLKKIEFFGVIRSYKDQLNIIAPTILQDHADEPLQIQYPTISGISSSQLKRLFAKIPNDIWESIEDPIPSSHLKKINLCHLRNAFKIIHGKASDTQKLSDKNFTMAKRRLIYQEFYLEQIKIEIRRNNRKRNCAPPLSVPSEMLEEILAHFPYELTTGQNQVIQDIIQDLTQTSPMTRMIQGDVGCGKTTVAFISAIIANLNGHQATLMCPTETLALQHYDNACPLFENFGFDCQLLTGFHSAKQKKEFLNNISSGKAMFVIGTHALFQKQVKFHKLALSIIDEQHKFGVNQRIKLSDKGHGAHTLIMTATPIPRSLSLTLYGDLDISTIKGLPPQRKGIQTRIITPPLFQKFLSFIKTRINMGEQAYLVAPAIEENPEHDLVTVEKIYQRFKKFFPKFSLGLLHGKLNPQEKQSTFKQFANGDIDLLIATSVIEVGTDVANASIMAIMGAERFGLSSLHQLRGRVGRGNSPGFCFLVTDSNNPESLQRPKIIEQTTNGLTIAEADLSLRGEGELFGLTQSGKISKRLANIVKDQELLAQVKQDFASLKNSSSYIHNYQKLSKELSIPLTL